LKSVRYNYEKKEDGFRSIPGLFFQNIFSQNADFFSEEKSNYLQNQV